MITKRFLTAVLICALVLPFCACRTEESTATVTTTTRVSTPAREIPDYGSMLVEFLGVEPSPSTFEELTAMTQKMKQYGFYNEDEEHHYCTLVYNENLYYAIRYEKAQEWFEYFFTYNDYLYFEEENGQHTIRDDSYTGPEGMLMPYNFVVFVDDSGKFLFIVQGYDTLPKVSDDDINAFKGFNPVHFELEEEPDMDRLRDLYPEFFDETHPITKGVEVYVWQTTEESYMFGLMVGTNRTKTDEEIWELFERPLTLDEAKAILNEYGVRKEGISVIPVIQPLSSYLYEIDDEYREKVKQFFE